MGIIDQGINALLTRWRHSQAGMIASNLPFVGLRLGLSGALCHKNREIPNSTSIFKILGVCNCLWLPATIRNLEDHLCNGLCN